MITGLDLVAEQIQIAQGELQRPRQVVEAMRLNVESTRKTRAQLPSCCGADRLSAARGPGVRMDSHVTPIIKFPYDSLIGKLIVWGPDRPCH